MLYGSLGVQIARAMLRTASAVGLGWNSKGLLEERTGYTNRLEPLNSLFCSFDDGSNLVYFVKTKSDTFIMIIHILYSNL